MTKATIESTAELNEIAADIRRHGYEIRTLTKFVHAHETQIQELQSKESLSADDSVISATDSEAESLAQDLRIADRVSTAFVDRFNDVFGSRLTCHSQLCGLFGSLRKELRRDRSLPVFWAVVEMVDCLNASDPEQLTFEQAVAIRRAISAISPTMDEPAMTALTTMLHDAGLRPWVTQRK